MGNWNITIQGTGAHHNGRADVDADLAAAEFVERLRAMGQQVESATFTHGGRVDLDLPRGKVKVIVNGREVEAESRLAYVDVLALANYGPERMLSVTYGKAYGNQQGILARGQSVQAVNGTVFCVADTSNA